MIQDGECEEFATTNARGHARQQEKKLTLLNLNLSLSTWRWDLHKQGRLWCQPLMFTCHQNGLYAIIWHSNITMTIFLHSSYTQIPRIINVTMIYLHPHKQDFGVNRSCSHPSRMVCMQSFHNLPSQSQFSCTSHIPRCHRFLENYIIITLL